jgi:hypothetical protein
MRVTNPSYISQQMFDKALREKLLENSDDQDVRQQGMTLMHLATTSRFREQILADILHAAKISRHTSKEQMAVIAFCMGLQFGFELALTYPPLAPS